jgi:hypothetical protein
MMPLKSISLYDAIKRQKEIQHQQLKSIDDNENVLLKTKRNTLLNNNNNNNHNVSKMYYNPDFSIGEDLHSNIKQEEEWKNTNIDGRQHVSHREQAKLRSKEFEEAINQYHIIKYFIKELTYNDNDDDDNEITYFTLLNLETIRIIIDYAFPGQGILLNSELMAYESNHDKENICSYLNVPFRLCVRKRPLQEFEHEVNEFDCMSFILVVICLSNLHELLKFFFFIISIE